MRAKFPWVKFLVGYGLYLFFHEIDRLLPGSVIGTIFGEGIESVYAHMKMLFYAYLILSIVDFFRLRKKGLPTSFFYARMFILAAVPWMMIATYYSLEAVGINLPRAMDLTWAIMMTAFGLYFSIRLEEPLEGMELRPALKSVIVVVFLAALLTYVGFSFHVPDNFFIAPD
ncbi:MAG: hypothetical protein EHM33_15470 [Chloroflexi bacterium]|nr:MAG: hypothetical protein EHM33_15470 [Chloroflexota bacterium]